VCRLKKNAVYEIQEVLFNQELEKNKSGVMKEEHIHLSYKDPENKQGKNFMPKKSDI
jgi:hypothetical protein